jgi:hypothetical protein
MAIAAALACFGFGLAPQVSAAHSSYDLEKTFTFNPGGNARPEVQHIGAVHTNATDASSSDGTMPPPPDNLIPENRTSRLFGFSLGPSAKAVAVSSAGVGRIAPAVQMRGTVAVTGAADSGINGTAHADSSARFKATGFKKESVNGNIQTTALTPFQTVLSSDETEAQAKARDPITFEVFDLVTGLTTTGSLFDFTMELNGPGTVSWGADSLIVDALNFTFFYDLTSPFIRDHGLIDFAITGGVVTRSTATGILAGLLPALGSTGVFNIALGELNLEYNLGNFGDHELEISFASDASGSADATAAVVAVPEPGTLAAGMLLAGFCATQIWVRRRRPRAEA